MVVESLQRDAKNFRRFCLVATGKLKRLQEKLAFDRAERHPHMHIQCGMMADIVRFESRGRARFDALWYINCDLFRQVRRRDHRPARNDERPLDHIAQLPYIPRPALRFEQLETFSFHAHNGFARGRSKLPQEMLDQGRDILGALA